MYEKGGEVTYWAVVNKKQSFVDNALSNVVSQSKKQNKKGMAILSSILMIIIGLFGILQVVEIISTIIEVF